MIERVEKIYTVLKRRRYNREEPFSETELKKRLQSFVDRKAPIKLAGFWGVGPKAQPNWADRTTCNWLEDMQLEMTKAYKYGLEYTFVIAAPHAVHNGIDPTTIASYVAGMEELFREFRFNFVPLEPLWKKYDISFAKIDEVWAAQPAGWWEAIPQTKDIEKNAARRNLRLDPKTAAQKYYIMRDLEKELWRKEFGDAIFHAFSDSRLRCVLPNLPTLYLYAREGWSDTPWFVTEN